MRGIQVSQYVKSAEELRVSDLPDPVPKPHEYLIAIHASAANFYDILQIQGKYQTQPPLPWVSGSEFAGVVIKVPTALKDGKKPKYKEGDRVFGASQGGYATLICAKEDSILPVPQGWSLFDAAGLFVTAPTSYKGLVLRGQVKKGDWVLVHAAAGGVGLAAVQIAKAFGATVIATAGTPHKLDVARRYGADHVIDYRAEKWWDQVRALTPKKRGVDIVYDPVGLVADSLRCIAWGGKVLVVGFAAGSVEKIATNRVLLKNASVVGVYWGGLMANEPWRAVEVWQGIFKLIAEGKYKGTAFTDREYVGLEAVPRALKDLGGRDSWGKVVIKVDQGSGTSKL